MAENLGGEPRSPATEAMLMILPRRWAIMTLPTAWEKRKVPVRLVSMTLFHCSRVISSVRAPQEVPALLMRMSMRPNSLTAVSATARMLAGSFTSQPKARVRTPIFCSSSAACWQRSFLRAQSTRLAPISAKPSAIWRPRPTEPPVMTATRPVRSNIGQLFMSAKQLPHFLAFQLKYDCLYHIFATNAKCRHYLSSQKKMNGQGAERSATERAEHRNRCVAPIRAAFAGYGQYRMGDARTEIARGIHARTGGARQRQN